MTDTTEGKQPLPAAHRGAIVQRLVQQDIEDRLEFSIGEYGDGLRAFNGRDPLLDAYQQVLDVACYLRQAIEEQRNPVDGVFTVTCDTCGGEGYVSPRQSMVSYVQNSPVICPTCNGNGWIGVQGDQ